MGGIRLCTWYQNPEVVNKTSIKILGLRPTIKTLTLSAEENRIFDLYIYEFKKCFTFFTFHHPFSM